MFERERVTNNVFYAPIQIHSLLIPMIKTSLFRVYPCLWVGASDVPGIIQLANSLQSRNWCHEQQKTHPLYLFCPWTLSNWRTHRIITRTFNGKRRAVKNKDVRKNQHIMQKTENLIKCIWAGIFDLVFCFFFHCKSTIRLYLLVRDKNNDWDAASHPPCTRRYGCFYPFTTSPAYSMPEE